MGDLSGISGGRNGDGKLIAKTMLRDVSDGNAPYRIGFDSIFFTSWKRICVYFACFLKIE